MTQLSKNSGIAFHKGHSLYASASAIHGMGLFAGENIVAGKQLCVVFVRRNNTGNFKEDFKENLLGRFVNHSFNPNTTFGVEYDRIFLIALSEIEKGNELTANYHELIQYFDGDESLVKTIQFW